MLLFLVSPEDDDPPQETPPITMHCRPE